MKKIITLLFILLSLNLYSQQIDTTKIITPGNEMIKFHKKYQAGTSLMLTGLSIGIISTYSDIKPLAYASLAVGIVGYFIQINSFGHLEEAGLLLNENGIGIKINLNRD
jgi:hypothetical protein